MEMWAIKTSRGDLLDHTVRPTRQEAISRVAAQPDFPWQKLYRLGWRAVRVVVAARVPDGRMAV